MTTIDPGAKENHEWAVILAGGDGTRLRSLTRIIASDERPKQFCPVIGDTTLVEETQARVVLHVARERTVFLLNLLHKPYYSEIFSGTHRSRLIEQPRNAGTAPAILYSALKIAAVDPQAVVAWFPSDHYISDSTKFMAHVRNAFKIAHLSQDQVILLGVEPERPETEYGWIEPAGRIEGHNQLRRVRRFWEKPHYSLAAVLQSRGCLWNSFVMVASARALLEMIANATPELYQKFACLSPVLGTEREAESVDKVYKQLTETNFSDRVLALVPRQLSVLKVTGITWNDLGEPKRVFASIKAAGARPGWAENLTVREAS